MLGALGHFAAKPLLAQIRAALVKNIDERGRSPYMVNAECDANGLASQCDASFPAVSANKRFVVEYANGQFAAAHGQFISAVLLVPSAGGFGIFGLPTHFEGTNGYNNDQYTISMPAVFYYEPDPREDCLSVLVLRLREVAFTLLETEERTVEFLAPSDDRLAIQLAPDMRRHLLLFFKEAVTNVARHADATASA